MKYLVCLICLCSGLNVFGQEVLLEEHFDKSYVAPPLWKGEQSKTYLDAGGYYIENLKDDASSYAKMEIDFSYNLVVEASFTLLRDSEEAIYGLSLGTSKETDNTFNFWINENDSIVTIGYTEQKHSGWMSTSALRIGEQNRLKIEMKEGKDFYFYLNGELVHSIKDYDYSPTDYYDINFALELYKPGVVFVDDVLAMNMKPTKGKINFFNLEGLIHERVMTEYSKWTARGEFETTAKYNVRMKQADQKLEELTQQAIVHFKQKHIEEVKDKDYLIDVMPYNAEEEYFTLKSEQLAPFKVYVPKAQARGFRYAEDELYFKKFDFKIKDNAWVLTYLEVYNPIEKVSYYYDVTKEPGYNPVHYTQTAKDFNIKLPN